MHSRCHRGESNPGGELQWLAAAGSRTPSLWLWDVRHHDWLLHWNTRNGERSSGKEESVIVQKKKKQGRLKV